MLPDKIRMMAAPEERTNDIFAPEPLTGSGYAVLTGFTHEQIKAMVDAVYGSCVWEKVTEDGYDFILCSPGDDGEVRIFE